MVCKAPSAWPCGQCTPCLVRLRNNKVSRGLLESFLHDNNSFVTLTYEQGFLPDGGNLRKEDVQKWLKKLRKAYGQKIRYLGCGEYGEGNWRPHYHLILFGYPQCWAPPPAHVKRYSKCTCPPCVMIQETWHQGFSDLRPAERKCIQYVCGYVTQRRTKKYKDKLGGRVPEFPLYSNRPGIGALAMRNIADALTCDQGAREILKLQDIPHVVRVGNKLIQLDRYMRFKLRQFYGFPEKRTLRGTVNNTPSSALQKLREKKIQEWDELLAKAGSSGAASRLAREITQQKVLNIEAKHNIFRKVGCLDGDV